MADEPHIILELPGSIVVNFVLTTKILKLISLLISQTSQSTYVTS